MELTEKEKMLQGMIYDAYDPELCKIRENVRKQITQFNCIDTSEIEKRENLLQNILGSCGKNVFMLDAQFDYGCNTFIGDEFSSNFNFVVLDCASVKIGNNVLIGPNVTIATPVHPLLPEQRNFMYDENGNRHLYEYAKPITIGNNVWIASNVTICAGVTIGDGCVIGAGSVVTKDIPSNVLAVGVPCKGIRNITAEDRINSFFNE